MKTYGRANGEAFETERNERAPAANATCQSMLAAAVDRSSIPTDSSPSHR
jgi:hypothetical protein